MPVRTERGSAVAFMPPWESRMMTTAKRFKRIGHVIATIGLKTFGSHRTFSVDGKEFHYFYHFYNNTYGAERCVEIPVVWSMLQAANGGDVLEIGNVLQHYFSFPHDVLDKYEIAEGVINQDVVTFTPGKRYSTIVSISTLEHVGFDEDVKEHGKPRRAIEHLKSLLTHDGTLILTAPVGYNPAIDEGIRHDHFGFDEIIALKRDGFSTWCQVSLQEALQAQWWSPYPYGNAIVIATYHAARVDRSPAA